MLFFNFPQQDRRGEDSVKYSSLESRFLGDVFKSSMESEANLNSYDGMLVFLFYANMGVFFRHIVLFFHSFDLPILFEINYARRIRETIETFFYKVYTHISYDGVLLRSFFSSPL